MKTNQFITVFGAALLAKATINLNKTFNVNKYDMQNIDTKEQ